MTRNEIISVLKDKGVNSKLLEMPAIVEYLYDTYLKTLTTTELLDSKSFSVDSNGNFTFGSTSFSLDGNGAKRYNTNSGRIVHINEYGIEDLEYSEDDWRDLYNNLSRKNGEIIFTSGNNGNGSSHRTTYLDKGNYSLSDSIGIRILGDDDYDVDSLDSEKIDSPQIDSEKLLAEFDSNSEEIKATYPITAEWYDQTRKSLLECIENQNNPTFRYKKIIEGLEKKVTLLQADNKHLTSMLNRSLSFIEDVRNSSVGRLFFGKKIQKYRDDSMSDGR